MTEKYILVNTSVEPVFILSAIDSDLKRCPIILEDAEKALIERDIFRGIANSLEIECYKLTLVDEAQFSGFSQGMIWSHNENI